MSKTKFTPGPWKNYAPEIKGKIYESYRTIEAGDGYFGSDGQDHGFQITGFISKANADLITAAPDLYESLEWLLGEIGNPEISTFGIEKCFDALAKARGE